jgi:hypothetical protein
VIYPSVASHHLLYTDFADTTCSINPNLLLLSTDLLLLLVDWLLLSADLLLLLADWLLLSALNT